MVIVKLVGPSLGQREVPIVTDIVADALEQYRLELRMLVLDLSQITFMNSMALGMCVDFRNRANALKAKVAMVGLNEELIRLIKMVKFDKLFTIARSVDELK
jgi:anti-anti-sigma factor